MYVSLLIKITWRIFYMHLTDGRHHKADSQICLCFPLHLTHALLYNLKLTEELSYWKWTLQTIQSIRKLREKTWDSYFPCSRILYNHQIHFYSSHINFWLPDRFSQTVWFCITEAQRPASFLCSLTESRPYHSLPPSPVVWFYSMYLVSTFLLSNILRPFHTSLFTFL